MKQYIIDELRPADREKIGSILEDKFGKPVMDNIYWISLAPDHYTDVQAAHNDCQPFYFAIELAPDALACELLVRTKQRVRCNCIDYATEKQRNWIIRLIDDLFAEAEIIT